MQHCSRIKASFLKKKKTRIKKYILIKKVLHLTIFELIYSARILVATGEPGRQAKKSEIIDLVNPKIRCDYMAGIALRSGSCGGLISSHPIVCGGYNEGIY